MGTSAPNSQQLQPRGMYMAQTANAAPTLPAVTSRGSDDGMPQPPNQLFDLPSDLQSSKFPLCPGGRCDHHADWTRVRGKRAYAYFFCRCCGMGWRLLRPREPQQKRTDGPPKASSQLDAPAE
eukprot:GGOE01054513.1.p4 GENE.GGOE01054513.1~~GGOE01054513.1.p4  ORF type:complete len:135 (+),score=15.39 GGOE01054513.1:38-406(+)